MARDALLEDRKVEVREQIFLEISYDPNAYLFSIRNCIKVCQFDFLQWLKGAIIVSYNWEGRLSCYSGYKNRVKKNLAASTALISALPINDSYYGHSMLSCIFT